MLSCEARAEFCGPFVLEVVSLFGPKPGPGQARPGHQVVKKNKTHKAEKRNQKTENRKQNSRPKDEEETAKNLFGQCVRQAV